MNKFIVSATTRDSEPEPVEIPWTRQVVASEADATRICVARNRAELAVNGSMVWGYYPADPDRDGAMGMCSELGIS